MDKLQCRMVSVLMRIPREAYEPFEVWCRRRGRAARAVCSRIGLWSTSWAKRVVSWHDHVVRSECRDAINSKILKYHDNEWLLHKRSQWIATNGINSNCITAFAGRTGTRLNSGHPQPRWEEGVALARWVVQSVDTAPTRGGSSRGLGSRIPSTISAFRELL